jgi:hypothetical protein
MTRSQIQHEFNRHQFLSCGDWGYDGDILITPDRRIHFTVAWAETIAEKLLTFDPD